MGDAPEADPYSRAVPPLPPRYRFRDLIWGDHGMSVEDESRSRRRSELNRGTSDTEPSYERVRVEFFTNEKSFKERLQLYFITNRRSSLRIRIFNLFIKLLSCVLYVVRVSLDDPTRSTCYEVPFSPCRNLTKVPVPDDEWKLNPHVDWSLIAWVNREDWLWGIQVSVAIISLIETLLLTYLGYKGNILQQIINPSFILECINTIPFIITIFWEPLRSLFIPVFLNCWLAKHALQNMLSDLHRAMQRTQSALSQQLLILASTMICIVFTGACGVQHLQRGGNVHLNLWDAFWFVVVTFSTVGYGDIYPDIWPSKLWMIIEIITAFIVIPTQFEQLAFTWMERQKRGGTYSSHRAQNEKHVVVCATTLHADVCMDFLNEFYAHPKLQDFYVVLLSPCELDNTMRMILQVPLWAARVIYIQGSALKDADLSRCRMQDAEACFILAARGYNDRTAADQHTIMRSWAVKDFAPHCPQYLQIFRPENKFHVKFAENVVCEDEFKYAMLANNCLCPGASTLVTLLLHTSRGAEGQTSHEPWMQLYGRCSGNEIYHIRLGDSKFFGDYEGKSFTYASFHAHRKYGVALVGVRTNKKGSCIQLNPGPRHILQATDLCFYMNITKEENSAFILAHPNPEKDPRAASVRRKSVQNPDISKVAGMITGSIALEMQRSPDTPDSVKSPPQTTLDLPKGMDMASLNRRPSIAPVPAILESTGIQIRIESESDSITSMAEEEWSQSQNSYDYVRGFPPTPPYMGSSPRLCHLLKTGKPLCCLQLAQPCIHNNTKHAREYNWQNRVVIVVADYASSGLYNFIVPLRSHTRPKNTLNPIVLLLEQRPDPSFLDSICHFPMVYWMIGSMDSLDDLLKAGINLADNVLIVNRESTNSMEEETLADCNTIIAVQTIFRLFPNANIITELSHASNMRFMQFRAKDSYSQTISKLEKKEKERGSHLYYMFRLPFAAGSVFSASMLDTLLYQAFVKDYLITFVRLLLGIDQAEGSGHLSCMKIMKEDLWIRTYGRLYQKLCSTTCEVPIGIYRTQTHVWVKRTDTSSHFGLRRLGSLRSSFRRQGSQKHKEEGASSPEGNKETKQVAPPTDNKTNNSSSGSVGRARARPKHFKYLKVDTQDSLDTPAASMSDEEHSGSCGLSMERQEISQMVKCRMSSLGLPLEDYDEVSDKQNSLSYVIINPSYDLKLEEDDIIYLIRPSSLSPKASPLIDERKLLMKRMEPTGADKDEVASPGSDTLHSQTTSPEGATSMSDPEHTEVFATISAGKGLPGTIV